MSLLPAEEELQGVPEATLDHSEPLLTRHSPGPIWGTLGKPPPWSNGKSQLPDNKDNSGSDSLSVRSGKLGGSKSKTVKREVRKKVMNDYPKTSSKRSIGNKGRDKARPRLRNEG